MSEVELLDFPEDPRSPLFEASKEEQKEFPAICRLSKRRVSCIPCPEVLKCRPAHAAECAGVHYAVYIYIYMPVLYIAGRVGGANSKVLHL